MDDIKIVRLQSGEDVIASYTTDKEGFVFLTNPMVFIVKRTMEVKSSVMLTHWLPIDVIERNVAQITKDDVLCLITPTEQFRQYYYKMIYEEYHGEGSYDGPENLIEESLSGDFDEFEDELYEDDYTNEEEQEEFNSILIEGNKTKH